MLKDIHKKEKKINLKIRFFEFNKKQTGPSVYFNFALCKKIQKLRKEWKTSHYTEIKFVLWKLFWYIGSSRCNILFKNCLTTKTTDNQLRNFQNIFLKLKFIFIIYFQVFFGRADYEATKNQDKNLNWAD